MIVDPPERAQRGGRACKKLSDVCRIVGGSTPKTSVADYWDGDVMWITPTEVIQHVGQVITKSKKRITQLGLEKSSCRLLPVDTVLLTSRASIGAVALVGRPMACNQGFVALIPDQELVCPRYLMHWCRLHTNDFVNRAGGSTFLEVSKSQVGSVPIDLPPLEEQHRVVTIMDSIDDYLRAKRAELDKLRTLRRVVLQDELSEERAQREGWERKKLGDVATLIRGRAPQYVDKGLLVIGQRCVRPDNRVDLSFGRCCDDTSGRMPKVRGGDILINTTGTGTLGRTAIICGDGVTFDTHVVAARPSVQVIDPRFLSYLLWMRQPLIVGAATGSSGQTGVSLMFLNTLGVVVPPIETQRRVVSRVRSIDNLVDTTQTEIDRLEELRKAKLYELIP